MAEPTLYLFDGFNLLHAGGFGSPEELRDLLASWVAVRGARGRPRSAKSNAVSSSASCASRSSSPTRSRRISMVRA